MQVHYELFQTNSSTALFLKLGKTPCKVLGHIVEAAKDACKKCMLSVIIQSS
jgi:hypothetical protein